MTRALIITIGVLMAIASLLAYGLNRSYREQAQLEVVAKSLTEALERSTAASVRDRKVLVARQASVAAERLLRAEAQEALQQALQADKPWSDTDVPPDVQNALGGLSSSPAGGL
jgi:hypothetical protein